jgi:hypothetical protein
MLAARTQVAAGTEVERIFDGLPVRHDLTALAAGEAVTA